MSVSVSTPPYAVSHNHCMVSGNPAKRSTTYFHGGVPGLGVGVVLLSKNAAARQGITGFWDLRSGGQHSPDHVYFTTDKDLARSFAHALRTPLGRGELYEVRPIGPVSLDPDYAGFADVFMASSATIVRVVQKNISLTRAQETRPFALRQHWDVGAPYVDARGFVQPSEQMRKAGWTPALLQLLPPWVPFEDLGDELSALALAQTSVVLAGSPGVGGVDRARWHKASGLQDDAITALCLEHYGSAEALHQARRQLAAGHGVRQSLAPRTSAKSNEETGRSLLGPLRRWFTKGS